MGSLLAINKQELTKLYYQIGEVAALFGLSTSTLRYWESEFSNIKPKKNRRGERSYQKKDITEVDRVYTLVKERGFTIEGAKKELATAAGQSGQDEKAAVIKKLKEIRKRMSNLLDSLSE